MSKAARYLQAAQRCLDMAQGMVSLESRKAMVDTAKKWMKLAKQVDEFEADRPEPAPPPKQGSRPTG